MLPLLPGIDNRSISSMRGSVVLIVRVVFVHYYLHDIMINDRFSTIYDKIMITFVPFDK